MAKQIDGMALMHKSIEEGADVIFQVVTGRERNPKKYPNDDVDFLRFSTITFLNLTKIIFDEFLEAPTSVFVEADDRIVDCLGKLEETSREAMKAPPACVIRSGSFGMPGTSPLTLMTMRIGGMQMATVLKKTGVIDAAQKLYDVLEENPDIKEKLPTCKYIPLHVKEFNEYYDKTHTSPHA